MARDHPRGVQSWTFAQHALIVEGLRERDAGLATSAATVHIASSEQWLRRLLDETTVAPSATIASAGLVTEWAVDPAEAPPTDAAFAARRVS